jgi:predicted nucleic acid-binding protein
VARRKRTGKLRPEEFVLDASATLAWAFEDEKDAYADAVADSLQQARSIVPSLWSLEVANALLMGERRGRITEARVTQFLTLLQLLPIYVDGALVQQVFSQECARPTGCGKG